jgi:hypothetical protein
LVVIHLEDRGSMALIGRRECETEIVSSLPNDILESLRSIRGHEDGDEPQYRGDLSDKDLVRLRDEGYLTFSREIGYFFDVTLTGKGLRSIGVWPSPADPVTALLEAINKAAESANDPDERSKLRTLGEAASEVGKNTLAGVLATVLVSLPSILS